MQRELPRRLQAGRHVGQPEGHGLVLEDRLAERLSLVRIAHGNLEGGLREPHALGADADASAFQVGERDAIALAFLAQPVLGGNDHVLQLDLAGVGRVLPIFFSMRLTT